MNSLYIAWNLCKRTVGNRKSFILLVLVPVIVISVVIGIFGGSASEIIKIAYVNADQGTLGDHVITGLAASDNYELISVNSVDEAKQKVISKDANVSFAIPIQFSYWIEEGTNVNITLYQLTQDRGTFSLKISLDREIARVTNVFQAAQQHAYSSPSITEISPLVEQLLLQQEKNLVKTQIIDMKQTDNGHFFTTIIGCMLLFVMTMVNSSIHNVVEDRVKRTMARIHTAPVRSFEIALGNFLGSFGIGTVQIVLILLTTTYALKFNYGLPLWCLFVILQFFMLSAIGIASAVAGMVKNINSLRNVNQLVIIPTCMIGGCFWPIWIMPDFMQKLANFTPQKWTIDAIERMSFGESIVDMGWHLGILLLFATILLAFGSYMLKPNESAS